MQFKKLRRSRTKRKRFLRKIINNFLNLLNSLLEPSDIRDKMANGSSIFDTLSAKLRILQEIDEPILDSLHDEQDIEKEIDESSKFELHIRKHQNRMHLWL